jgi:hypothetical protein
MSNLAKLNDYAGIDFSPKFDPVTHYRTIETSHLDFGNGMVTYTHLEGRDGSHLFKARGGGHFYDCHAHPNCRTLHDFIAIARVKMLRPGVLVPKLSPAS